MMVQQQHRRADGKSTNCGLRSTARAVTLALSVVTMFGEASGFVAPMSGKLCAEKLALGGVQSAKYSSRPSQHCRGRAGASRLEMQTPVGFSGQGVNAENGSATPKTLLKKINALSQLFAARSQGTIDGATLKRDVGIIFSFSNKDKAAAAAAVAAPMPLMPDSGILQFPPVTAEDLLLQEANKMDTLWEKALTKKPEEEPEPEGDGDGLVDMNVARLLVLISAALYGTNFGSVKILQGLMDPSLAAAARFSIAAVALSPLLRSLKGRSVVEDGVKIGMLNAVGYIAQGMSLTTADASTAAFLCSLAVVVCPMMDAVAGVKVSASAWSAVALAVGGAAVLELGGGAAPGVGDLLALVQPIAFGAGFWMMEKAMRKNPDQGGPLTAVQLITVALCALVWSVLSDTSGTPMGAFPSMDAVLAGLSEHNVQLALAWTGLITTALTVFLETMALGKLPSAEVTVLFSTEPLWGTAFAAVALGEQIGVNTIAGGSLIMAAVATRTFGGSKEGEKFFEGLRAKLGFGGDSSPPPQDGE